MSSAQNPQWGDSYRLIAAEKWKAKSAAMGRDVTRALVDYAQPQPGMQVLDLACGTGEPAISLAAAVGPDGHVTALDQSAKLLEIASDRAQQRGFTNFSTIQADAHDLPFADNTFDLATSRFGVMFFHDCVRALRQLCRVLRPSARACFVAWGPFDQPYWSSTMGIVVKHLGGPALTPGGPDPFCFSRPGSLSEILKQAGFHDVIEQTRTLSWTWPGSTEEVWEYAKSMSTPFRPLLQRVPPEKWDEINRDVHAAIQRYAEGNSLNFGAAIVFASGKKSRDSQ